MKCIKDICLARDILTQEPKIHTRLGIFEKLAYNLSQEFNQYLKDDTYEISYTKQDLLEMLEEVEQVLSKYNYTYEEFIKIASSEPITVERYQELLMYLTNRLNVCRTLNHFRNVVCYISVVYDIYEAEMSDENQMMFAIQSAIKSSMNRATFTTV